MSEKRQQQTLFYCAGLFASVMIMSFIFAMSLIGVILSTRFTPVPLSNSMSMTNDHSLWWTRITPKGLKQISIYDDYNTPPLPSYMNLKPSARHSMSCCVTKDRSATVCYGGYGIKVDHSVNKTTADMIRVNNALLYTTGNLNDYWLFSNVDHSWKLLQDNHIGNDDQFGYHSGGCWTDGSNDKGDPKNHTVWFGGGQHSSQMHRVVPRRSKIIRTATSNRMPDVGLRYFSYWTDHRMTTMFIFGGVNDAGRYVNSVHYRPFSPVHSNWTTISYNTNVAPYPRVNALLFRSPSSDTGDIYLYGGQGKSGDCFKDLWSWNSNNRQWTLMFTSNSVKSNHRSLPMTPGCRHSAHSIHMVSSSIAFHGGVNHLNQTMNDVWRFSLSQRQWQWVGGSHSPDMISFEHPDDRRHSRQATMPAVRSTAHWVDHRGKNYIFGGCSDHCRLSHSWVWMK